VTFWQFLNHWWNLPYLVMLGLVGVFFAMQAIGIFADAAGSDHEADVDGSAEAADHDPGPDHQAEHDADGHGGDHPHGLGVFLGVGRVPFMVVWLTLFIFTGFSGLFFNRSRSSRRSRLVSRR